MTEKMPSSVSVGSRPRIFKQPLVFVGLEAMLGDDFGRDGGLFGCVLHRLSCGLG